MLNLTVMYYLETFTYKSKNRLWNHWVNKGLETLVDRGQSYKYNVIMN